MELRQRSSTLVDFSKSIREILSDTKISADDRFDRCLVCLVDAMRHQDPKQRPDVIGIGYAIGLLKNNLSHPANKESLDRFLQALTQTSQHTNPAADVGFGSECDIYSPVTP